MAVYTIIRVYEVPAENRIQATERMLEALQFHTEADFHVKDYVRSPGNPPERDALLTCALWAG